MVLNRKFACRVPIPALARPGKFLEDPQWTFGMAAFCRDRISLDSPSGRQPARACIGISWSTGVREIARLRVALGPGPRMRARAQARVGGRGATGPRPYRDGRDPRSRAPGSRRCRDYRFLAEECLMADAGLVEAARCEELESTEVGVHCRSK